MKIRNILYLMVAGIALAMTASCTKAEPSTYHELLYRVATVKCNNGKVGLDIDCTGESFYLHNFKDSLDMVRFKLQNGDRIIAAISFDAVSTMSNATITLEDVIKYDSRKFQQSLPSDTLNSFYQFSRLQLIDLMYPAIWSTGHIVNLAPVYLVPKSTCKADFLMYPLGVSGDTLVVRLYSDIPDDDISILSDGYTQSFICCDISSLRDSVPDATEQARRSTLLTMLENLNQDSIMVKFTTPDSLRAKYSGSESGKYIQYYPSLPLSVAIPFDF